MKKIFIKSILIGMGFAIGIAIVYAATITSLSGTVNGGDTITADWYNSVNQKLKSGALNETTIRKSPEKLITSDPESVYVQCTSNETIIGGGCENISASCGNGCNAQSYPHNNGRKCKKNAGGGTFKAYAICAK